MRRAKRTIIILGLALAGCRGPMAVPTATPQTVTIHIMATTATAPLLRELAAAYDRPGTLLAISSAVANWATISNRLLSGETSFALTTYLSPDSGLWAAPIGQDGIAIITDAANAIPFLTLRDLRRIFQGQVTSWAQLGGADSPLTVVSREDGADTRFVFEALVMDAHPITPGARLALSSESMVEIVASTPGVDRVCQHGLGAVSRRRGPDGSHSGRNDQRHAAASVSADPQRGALPAAIADPDRGAAPTRHWDRHL